MNNQQLMDAAFARIRPRFLAALSLRFDEMLPLRQAAEVPKTHVDALNAIKSGAHKTVGSAETLGFVQLGRTSSQAEVAIYKYISTGGQEPALRDMFAQVDRMLAEMRAALGK